MHFIVQLVAIIFRESLLIPAGFLPTIVLDTDSENEILSLQTFRQLKTDAVKTEQLQASMNEHIEYAVTKVRLEAQAVVRDLQDQLQKAKASCWKLEVQIKQYKEASTLAQGDGAKQLNNLNDGPSKEVGCLSEFAWSCHAHQLVADVCSTFVKWDLAVPLAWIMARSLLQHPGGTPTPFLSEHLHFPDWIVVDFFLSSNTKHHHLQTTIDSDWQCAWELVLVCAHCIQLTSVNRCIGR